MKKLENEFYEISAVSKLTGISSHLLRMWERRYSVVEPDRSDSKRRRYTRRDVQKLGLLKELVSSGHSIGSIANLSLEQLEERHSHLMGEEPLQAEISIESINCRIAVVGQNTVNIISELSVEHPGIRLVGQFRTISELNDTLRESAADILIVESQTLFRQDVSDLSEAATALMIPHAIAICEFAERDAQKEVDSGLFTVLRAPVGESEILYACAVASSKIQSGRQLESNPKSLEPADNPEFRRTTQGEIPEKRYSHSDLVRIGKLSSVVKCECPQHLARLISSLSAFESYSRQCEDKNEEDAKLHGFLHLATAKCRASMEEALAEVLKHEEIDI